MADVIAAEFAKLRRSGVPWVTAAVMVVAVLGAALLIWIVRDPERAASLGLLGTKANLAGLEATWTAFGTYVTAIAGAGGLLLLAFVVTYLFGREYADDTAKNMLGLPTPRWRFVVAKLAVAAAWWLALVALLLAAAFGTGALLDLDGFSGAAAAGIVGGTLFAAGVSFLLVPVCAWITIATRSYLAPLGFALGMLLLGNLLGHTGWASWFPWSIVALLATGAGGATVLPWTSYAVLVATFAAGVAGAIHRLAHADNP